jgi:hypothetical protein
MVWTVKYAYEHWNEDVLLVMHLGLPEEVIQAVSDPRVIDKMYLRSDDRAYAELFLSWENQTKYREWLDDHPNWTALTAEMQKYLESFGMSRTYYDPPSEDYDWTSHPSIRPDKVQFPKHVIDQGDIYLPPTA